MDRGPPRAFPLVDPGARPVLEGRDRGRRRGQDPRPARHHDPRQRRLPAVGDHRALHRLDDVSRPLCGAGVQVRDHGRAHQPGADHGGARRRPAAGGVRDGAADGSRGARARHRRRRAAPPQHDHAGADAVPCRPRVSRRQAARLCERRLPVEPDPRHGARGLRRLPRPPGGGAQGRPLYRDRHRQLRRGHRARPL